MKLLLTRLLLLTLCAVMALTPALGEGIGFRLTAQVHTDAFPAEQHTLLESINLLLEAAHVEGSFVLDGGSFALDATLHLGDSTTDVQVQGIDSHWTVRSSLLGDAKLMVNCASLLPFGVKARDYLGLPLDAAALLIPYTHVDALSAVLTLVAPLFPAEDGKITLSRAEMDALVTSISDLCDTDPAFNRYLRVTGLYSTVKYYCRVYFSVPSLVLPSLTVKRSGGTLTWRSGLFTLLTIQQKNLTTTLTFDLPTLAHAEATLMHAGDMISGSATIDIEGLEANASFALPLVLAEEPIGIHLTVDVASAILPMDEVHLRITGQTQGENITLQLMDGQGNTPVITVMGTLSPLPEDGQTLPDWTPADFTGVNILSVNGDSLRALLGQVKWPLLTGLMDLVAAAPAPAVQSLMDWAEDTGLFDLLTDALSGGSGY